MRRPTVAFGLASICAVGCTTLLPEPVECESAADCRRAFSHGSVCGDDGLCTPPSFPARCGRAFPNRLLEDPEDFRDHVLLASLFSFEEHEDTLLASELAVRQATEQLTEDQQPIAILHCDYTPGSGDSLSDVEAIESLAPFLGGTLEVAAVIGPRGSERTITAFNALAPFDTLLISPSATSPALTALEPSPASDEEPGRLWRTVPPDSLQSSVIARDMDERGVRSVAVLYQTGSYGEGLTQLFGARFSALGGTVALLSFAPSGDFSLAVAQVADGIERGLFDEVLFISSDLSDYTKFFQSATATPSLAQTFSETLGSGAAEGGIFLPDTGYNVALLDETVATSEALFAKVRGSRPAPAEGIVFNAFAAAFRAEFGADSIGSAFTPHSYDATWMALYGMAWAMRNEAEVGAREVGRGLRRLSQGTMVDVLPTNWTVVDEAFAAGQSVDIRGASGELDYDPASEETVAPVERWKIVADPSSTSGYALARIDTVDP